MTAAIDHDPTRYPPFSVTADVVVLARRDELMVVLVRRANEPFAGKWALPGGFVDIDEGLAAAAMRELSEETGIAVRIEERDLFGVYGHPDRDPRMRVISVAFRVMLDDLEGLEAASDAAEAQWWPVGRAVAAEELLAFDHHQILSDAIAPTHAGDSP